MGQYFRDFSGDAVGTFPSGFTQILGADLYRVQQDSFDKYLEITGGADKTNHWLVWDGALSPGDITDADLLVKYRCPGTGNVNFLPVSARYAPTGNQTICARHPFRVEGGIARDFSYSALSNVPISPPLASDGTWHFARLSVIGDTFKAKYWQEGESEPLAWDAEVTGGAVIGSGPVGLSRYGSATYHWAFIAVGTNGDPAPTGPVTSVDSLSANDISSASETSTATIDQTHSLSSTSVSSNSELTQPSLSSASTVDSLTAVDISSASQVSVPALGQIHNIAANDTASASETSAPTLRQAHDLTSVSIQSLSQVSSPSLQSVAGQDSIAANDVESASSTSEPALAQVHVLQSATVESSAETSSPAITQAHNLNSAGVSSASEVSSPTLIDASQVLTTPIKNTKATVSQSSYRAISVTTTYKAAIIQSDRRAGVA